MEALLIGVAASFNFLIIYWKIEHKRFLDAGLDAGILFILASLFSQSTGGMVIATIASAVVSLVLLIKKPKIPIDESKMTEFISEFKKRMPQQ